MVIKMDKKINDKLIDKLHDKLSPIIENYIKIKTLIYLLEANKIEKIINIIKEGKEGEGEHV